MSEVKQANERERVILAEGARHNRNRANVINRHSGSDLPATTIRHEPRTLYRVQAGESSTMQHRRAKMSSKSKLKLSKNH